MIKTKLVDKLSILFPQGMHYQEAVEISKTLFCSTSWLPDERWSHMFEQLKAYL